MFYLALPGPTLTAGFPELRCLYRMTLAFRPPPDYASGGWGFESLAARTKAPVNGLGLLALLVPLSVPSQSFALSNLLYLSRCQSQVSLSPSATCFTCPVVSPKSVFRPQQRTNGYRRPRDPAARQEH